MPPWMVLGYFPRGRLGYWSTDLLGSERPQQVIGHAHYIPGRHNACIVADATGLDTNSLLQPVQTLPEVP